MTVTVELSGRLKMKQAVTAANIAKSTIADFDFGDSLSDGLIIDKCDLVYAAKSVAISGSGTNNLDVAGSLSDFYGSTITAVKLKFFYLKNLSTTPGDILRLGNDTNELLLWSAGATQDIGPNGFVLIWEPSLAGIPVTATTGDILKILEVAGNANTYDVAFGGVSA